LRIFAALDLPAGVRAEIGVWQQRETHASSGLKWVEPGLCHLTLRFLGDVGQDSVGALSRILESWLPGPLPFTIDSAGSFGGVGKPVVYWLGGTVPDQVIRLALRLGTVPDDRGRVHAGGFIPHITVARSRGAEERLEFSDPPCMAGLFSAAAIYDSRLTPRGPEYRTIQRFDISRTHRVADDGQSDGR
jgi:RNA 2',3'-cyclic 3'-phosphodiesterase